MARALRGAVAVVTGASSGIGAATAVACGRAGMRVALAARRAGQLESVAAQVRAAGGEARVAPTDVSDPGAVAELIDGTVSDWGRLDALVNNAGVGLLASVAQTTTRDFERLMQVNFFGALHGVQAALPYMRRQGAGHIVNVASVVGKRASPFRAAYVASKFALVGLSEALRMELAREGIHVTCVCPIGTETEFFAAEENRLGIPGRRGPVQSAEHVARAIVRALARPRAEIHPYPAARVLFVLNAVAPGIVDRLLMSLSHRGRRNL
jgi:short-subunit dehydrogenase